MPAVRPSSRLVIEFGHTTSANRAAATRLARRFRLHRQHGEGREVHHVCPVALGSDPELRAALKLLGLVSCWKSASVLLDDVPARTWEVERVLTCALAKRSKGPEGRATHCAGNGHANGERALRVPCRVFAYYDRGRVEWWRHGVVRDGVFYVDRAAVQKELEGSAADLGCGWCPGLERKRMKDAVAKLPVHVDPENGDGTWKARKVADRVVGIEPARPSAPDLRFEIGFPSLQKEEAQADTPAVPDDGPTFADIGGLEEPLRELRERIEAPLRHPEVFQKLGVEPPRGVLLVGPPGCGKTLIARALAREAGARFFAVCVTELLDKYVGESERNVRRLFERAAESAPAIVFLDEIDALGYDRGSAQHGWEVRPLTQLLAILDGFQPLHGVAVLAATNRVECLDPALLRPGRFDRIVEVPPPSRDGRRAILGIHTKKMPLAPDVDLEELTDQTPGFTGAELRALCQDAALAAWRRVGPDRSLDELQVAREDFQEALPYAAAIPQ